MLGSIIIDKNLSHKLIRRLSEPGFTLTHVSFENLDSSLDTEIWEFAKQRGMAILTKDTDFKTLSSLYGCPPKVIRINCGNKTTAFIQDLLLSKKEMIQIFLSDNDDCYFEISDPLG